MAIKEKIRVRLKSYDHVLIDTAAKKIVEVATLSYLPTLACCVFSTKGVSSQGILKKQAP